MHLNYVISYDKKIGAYSTIVLHLKKKKIHVVFVIVRAPTAGVVNVPNVKYLAHLPHQTQK